MVLARGTVNDRPFGKTVGMVARRGVTGQLTVNSLGTVYAIAFAHGHVVAASSPGPADRIPAIAVALDLMTLGQAENAYRWLRADPLADELAVCAKIALLTPDQVQRLRRRAIAQRAARVFGLEHGEFELSATVTLPIEPDSTMHVGGVIYQGALTDVSEPRLTGLLRQLGDRFALHPNITDELPYFGFGDRERAFLHALAAGVTIEQVFAIENDRERRIAMAVLYALASCGGVYCETATPRLARGTQQPLHARPRTSTAMPVTSSSRAARATLSPPMPRTSTGTLPPVIARTTTTRDESSDARHLETSTEPVSKSIAAEAFRRGQACLRADRVLDAVLELERAAELEPKEPTYLAALAWARFCKANDKLEVANDTRRALARAIHHSENPVLARYYLGMVERILGRTDKAVEHFQEVLELDPRHAEAATELRFLTTRR